MIWNIISDSSSDLLALDNDMVPRVENGADIRYTSIPFVISVGSRDFIDDDKIDTDELVDAMIHSKEASHTACPSPQAFADAFEQPGNCIALTISSNLSGSYNSACTAKDMVLEKYPDKKIAVIDTHSTGPEMILCIQKMCKMIDEGQDFDTIVKAIEDYVIVKKIVFTLCSFNNLVKNGRMKKITGFLAGKLGFWGIGIGTQEGTISIKGKVRGAKSCLNAIIQDIQERGEEMGTIIIHHCQNLEFANEVKDAILKTWKQVEVKVIQTRGLTSFYAEKGGLIIAY